VTTRLDIVADCLVKSLDEPTEKVSCAREEYWAALDAAGGIHALVVRSSYTYVDDPGTTPFGPGRHIFTEWGTRDGRYIGEHEEHNGEHTYRKAAK
jgi:hypothetical protein